MTGAVPQGSGSQASKQRTLKVGVVGLGIAGTRTAERLAKHPNVELVAAADVRPQALEEMNSMPQYSMTVMGGSAAVSYARTRPMR